MASSMIASLSEGGVEVFLERLCSYFQIEKVKAEARVHVLILGLSEKQYSLVRDHATPLVPSEMQYDVIVAILRQCFRSARNRMTERAKFREVKRTEGEPENDFVARLKSGSRYCEFGDRLIENLVEQFRVGINVNNFIIRKKLIDMPYTQQKDVNRMVSRAQEVELTRKLSGDDSQASVQVVQVQEHVKTIRPHKL